MLVLCRDSSSFEKKAKLSETEKETKTLRLLLKAKEVLALIENKESMYVCKKCFRKLAKVSGIWEQIASGFSVANEKIKNSESCQDTRKRLVQAGSELLLPKGVDYLPVPLLRPVLVFV